MDPRPNYITVDRSSPRRAVDYAPFRRQLRVSLRPASIIGPGLGLLLLALSAAVIVYAIYWLQ